MALITTVVDLNPLGREGMLATTQPIFEMIVSRALSTELVPGRAVIRGATDNLVVHPSGSAGVFVGLVCEDQSISTDLPTVAGNIPATYDARIMTKGIMWVVPETDVVQGGAVYYRHTGAGSAPEALGRLRADADTADATLIAGAKWFTSGSAGTLAMVELNTP
jgi:hypothetical protein